MSTVLEDYGLRAVQVHAVTGLSKVIAPVIVPSTEIIGIEVEVENATNIPDGINRAWMVTSDGSLRNNGLELITRPIMASAAPVVLEYLLKNVLNEECCFSPRTSVHVHLNMQDVTRAQVIDLMLMYVVYEKMFYQFTGRGRQKNIYCVPLADCDLLPNLVDFGETRDRRWTKYTGLNTLPLLEKGTVEFRHMHGTFDVEKLSIWVNLITKLKEYVKRTSTKTIRSMIAEMNDGFDFESLMRDIWGETAAVFKYGGPTEMNYLQAKQAIASRNSTRLIAQSLSRQSPFFNFKG